MSRDYKSRKSSKSANEKSGSAFFGGFIGYALGVMSAIGIWLYLNYAPSPFLPTEKVASSTEKRESRATPEQPKASTKPIQEEPVSVVEEKPRFDFYKILPGIDEPEIDLTSRRSAERPAQPPVPAKIPESIIKPMETARPSASPPNLSPVETTQHSAATQLRSIVEPAQQSDAPQVRSVPVKEKFFLQAGAFRKSDDAEDMKARLALLGVLASIQPIDLEEKGVWW